MSIFSIALMHPHAVLHDRANLVALPIVVAAAIAGLLGGQSEQTLLVKVIFAYVGLDTVRSLPADGPIHWSKWVLHDQEASMNPERTCSRPKPDIRFTRPAQPAD